MLDRVGEDVWKRQFNQISADMHAEGVSRFYSYKVADSYKETAWDGRQTAKWGIVTPRAKRFEKSAGGPAAETVQQSGIITQQDIASLDAWTERNRLQEAERLREAKERWNEGRERRREAREAREAREEAMARRNGGAGLNAARRNGGAGLNEQTARGSGGGPPPLQWRWREGLVARGDGGGFNDQTARGSGGGFNDQTARGSGGAGLNDQTARGNGGGLNDQTARGSGGAGLNDQTARGNGGGLNDQPRESPRPVRVIDWC